MSETVSYVVFSCEQGDETEDRIREQLTDFTFSGIDRATLLVSYPTYTVMYFLICQDPDGEWRWLQTTQGDWHDIAHRELQEIFFPSATSYTLIGA